MSKLAKRLILLSMALAAIVALASIVDIIMGIPFNGGMVLDIMFLLGAALIGYMGYEVYREAS